MDALPIESLLPKIAETLQTHARLILGAPPGAGKTTRVPLALAGLIDGFEAFPGKIVMLEPRRIAARMAATRMAQTLGERLGQRIGLSTRVDRQVSTDTVVEVITDGLFTRRLLSDPELTGISVVIFDEIHERSLSADLGLTLAQEAQGALRDDLHLFAMSATLDTETMARQLDAPVIASEGRQYPVDTRYLGRNRDRLEDQMARAIERAVRETDGSVLAFLPGAGEIRRTAERLSLPLGVLIAPLFGALSPKEQDAAIRPSADGQRKVVLATDIAESALTIDGVSVVVDSGYARVPRYVPGGLSTELQTVRAAKANVDQRRGRAGRLGPGICYRLWDEAETRGLTPAPEPEIQNADLSGLMLTLADWGETEPERLNWLTPPPKGRLAAARRDLHGLGAITEAGALTPKGRHMSRLPLAPRLAALIVGADTAGEKARAAQIAALISERGMGGQSADLAERLARFQTDSSPRAKKLKAQAARWGGSGSASGDAASLLAKGWPDMIARRRSPGSTQYLLANGRGGQVDETSPLAKSDWLVVADMAGSAKSARITLAAAIDEATATRHGRLETRDEAEFDPSKGTFKARRVSALGAIILSEQPLPKPSHEAARTAFLKHLESDGFGPTGLDRPVQEMCARLAALNDAYGDPWPIWSVEALQAEVLDWLGPALGNHSFTMPKPATLADALKARLEWPLPRDLDSKAPRRIKLPAGREAPIDWLSDRAPLIECKAQELYGSTRHLFVADGRIPVTLQILSPGGKPVATTQDLPGFWAGGYRDMAKDMRGRYPKHDWPDDPAAAKPHAGMTKARLAKG
ncbi:MAG: ATP-dependent helicase HrpB [Hyphomonadaceae bacterium]|nr:ATP-dependent helicase HrpB [Hyphomonadaceae bacterium]